MVGENNHLHINYLVGMASLQIKNLFKFNSTLQKGLDGNITNKKHMYTTIQSRSNTHLQELLECSTS